MLPFVGRERQRRIEIPAVALELHQRMGLMVRSVVLRVLEAQQHRTAVGKYGTVAVGRIAHLETHLDRKLRKRQGETVGGKSRAADEHRERRDDDRFGRNHIGRGHRGHRNRPVGADKTQRQGIALADILLGQRLDMDLGCRSAEFSGLDRHFGVHLVDLFGQYEKTRSLLLVVTVQHLGIDHEFQLYVFRCGLAQAGRDFGVGAQFRNGHFRAFIRRALADEGVHSERIVIGIVAGRESRNERRETENCCFNAVFHLFLAFGCSD